jgi:hypothetical protein
MVRSRVSTFAARRGTACRVIRSRATPRQPHHITRVRWRVRYPHAAFASDPPQPSIAKWFRPSQRASARTTSMLHVTVAPAPSCRLSGQVAAWSIRTVNATTIATRCALAGTLAMDNAATRAVYRPLWSDDESSMWSDEDGASASPCKRSPLRRTPTKQRSPLAMLSPNRPVQPPAAAVKPKPVDDAKARGRFRDPATPVFRQQMQVRLRESWMHRHR